LLPYSYWFFHFPTKVRLLIVKQPGGSMSVDIGFLIGSRCFSLKTYSIAGFAKQGATLGFT
jgi:hypothetical protein